MSGVLAYLCCAEAEGAEMAGACWPVKDDLGALQKLIVICPEGRGPE